jgi:REP element-mobilizing transposase RayT
MKVQPGIGYLRAYRRAKVLEEAFREARERYGVRIIHYSIQGNHLHLLVEAENSAALSRAMQGLAIRIAKRLNALAGRRGGVFADRYHAHALATRREVANAVRYVLGNYRHHTQERLPPKWDDPFSSALYLRRAPGEDAPVVEPKTWLLRVGWRLEAAAVLSDVGAFSPRLASRNGIGQASTGFAGAMRSRRPDSIPIN